MINRLRRGIRWLAVVILMAVSAAAVPAADEIGRIKMARGDAVVERGGVRIPAEPGLALVQADRLLTGPDGRIAATFVDNSRFSVERNSNVLLEFFTFDSTSHEGAFETRIDAGSMAIVSGQIAKKTPDAMRVRTPTTIFGARGTRFIVEVGR